MARCVACGKPALMPETLGKITFCKMCSLGIQIPLWKNKLFANAEKLKEQKEKTLIAAKNRRFSQEAIDGIAAYFSDEEDAGFMGAINGGCGQTIKVYRSYCIINTDKEKFDINEISKSYAKAQQSTKPHIGFFDNQHNQEAVVKGILSGRILETGKNLATSAALDAARKGVFPQKAAIQVSYGDRIVRYSEYGCFDFMNVGNSEIGYIRFYNNNSDVVFFFNGNSGFDEVRLKKKMIQIRDMIDEGIHTPVLEEVVPKSEFGTHTQSSTNFDMIREYKQLMDEGIITVEEFEKKKRDILNL